MVLDRSKAGLIVSVAVIALLSGCGKSSKDNEKLDNLTVPQIYALGETNLNKNKDYKAAAHDFSELQRLYPYSDWGKRATIMESFADHQAKKYDESRAAAQRYLDFYPADEDAAYAQYLIALSYYDQIDSVGRDQGVTFQALQALRKVIEGYPDSPYGRSAVLKFDLAFDHLAGKEMEIGRYYLKHGDYAAAINRFRVVVEQYQTTTYTPEALERLVEAYTALGLTDQAQTAAAIIGYNFRSSPFYDDAFRLLKGKRLAPGAKGHSWLTEIWRQTVQNKWL